MQSLEEFVKELLKFGTPQCGLFCGVLGFILALCFLLLGFWKTLFILLVCAVAVFCGGVKEKSEFIKKAINRIAPPKDN